LEHGRGMKNKRAGLWETGDGRRFVWFSRIFALPDEMISGRAVGCCVVQKIRF
jgi:hypothetical protein